MEIFALKSLLNGLTFDKIKQFIHQPGENDIISIKKLRNSFIMVPIAGTVEMGGGGVLTDFAARVTWSIHSHFDGFLVQSNLRWVCTNCDREGKTFP